MFKLTFIIFGLSLVLSGCANMNKSMCLSADWQNIGFEDGAAGRPQTEIAQHRKDCAEHGVSPDLSAYRQGHDAGSMLFCTNQMGFKQGSAGKTYQNNCPESLAPAFLAGFRDGEAMFAIKSVLDEANKRLASNAEQIDSVQAQLEQQNELIIADGLIREERLKIRQDIESLKSILDDLYLQQEALQQQSQEAQVDLVRAARRFAQYN